jgi:hypothetical protein
MDKDIKEVQDMKLLVRQLTRTEEKLNYSRINFTGGISKILFGTMDSEDSSCYTDKISNLEKEQPDFLKLSKEQITCQIYLKIHEFHFNRCFGK